MKRPLLIIVFLSSVFSLYAQDDNNFPLLTEKDIPGGKIFRTSYYTGDALWGLIDGGADIYLEYGFDKLLFQEVEWKGQKFRVEFYRMNNAKAAFGIFSISRYKCTLNDTLTEHICITPYQMQAALGKFYISIVNEKGNQETQILTTELFNTLLRKIDESAFELPEIFNQKIFKDFMNQMKFMKGKLGLQNGFPAWIEMFDNFSNYEVYLLPIESDKGYAYISLIEFESEKEMQKFISENKTENQSNLQKKIKILTANEIVFIESDLPESDLIEFTGSIYNK